MTNVAREILTKHPDETRAIAMLFGEKLGDDDALTGIPTATVIGTDSALTSSVVSIGGARIIKGQYRAAGSVAEFTLAGGTDGVTYTVKVASATLLGETIVGLATVEVSDEVA